MDKIVNIPLELVKQSVCSRDGLTALAFAVFTKLKSPSSCYIISSSRRIRNDLKCGKSKADRISRIISERNDLFRICGNHVTSISFKKSFATRVKYAKSYFRTFAMNAIKLKVSNIENLSIAALEKEIRLLFIQSKINARQRADEFILNKRTGSTFSKNFQPHAANIPMSLKKLCRKSGRCASTVCKYVKELEVREILNIERHELERTPNGYFKRSNEYLIPTRDLQKRFAHIIFGHNLRCFRPELCKHGYTVVNGYYYD